ncbi:DUF1294 domain-containing protein [Brevibacillus sp. TJ4]|uniref:DUF1294 domain-containing protein n=1 Tax=Brevibacillus sp. TJ4 TaxID=3234853 RepID=UPI0037CF2919
MQTQLVAHRRKRNGVLATSVIVMAIGALTAFFELFLAGFLLANGYALLVMAKDKSAAKQGGFRIPEKSLLLTAALGGGAGVLLAMLLYRHKTRHVSFQLLVPLCCLVHLLLLLRWIGWI